MLKSSEMKDPRRNSTTRKDEEKTHEDHDGTQLRSQDHVVNSTESPHGSAPRTKPESSQQTRRASPSRAEIDMGRRAGTEFDGEVRKYDNRRPALFPDQRDGRGYDDKRFDFDALDSRRRSVERQRSNQRHTRCSPSQERSQHGQVNNETDKHRNYEDHRQRTGNRQFETERNLRPASLGRYNGDLPKNDRYGRNCFGSHRSGRDFSGSSDVLARKPETEDRRSHLLDSETYAREQVMNRGQFPDHSSRDEHGRFYRDQSQRRRSQSVGRHEDDRMSDEHFGKNTFEEPKNRRYRYEMPRSNARYAHPSREEGNYYYGSRAYDEEDEYRFVPNDMFRPRYDQLYFDRFAVDRFGLDRLGVQKFGYDRHGKRLFFER